MMQHLFLKKIYLEVDDSGGVSQDDQQGALAWKGIYDPNQPGYEYFEMNLENHDLETVPVELEVAGIS